MQSDQPEHPHAASFMRACAAGDVDAVRTLLVEAPALARERLPGDTTALHLAGQHPEVVRMLLAHGADPNARDGGDNATPLHFAAAHGNVESVRLLLDAGADVHGTGDVHNGEVIGWAARRGNEPVIDLLLARGARHHIFSAMALRDRDLVQRLVAEDRECLSRTRSRFENSQTPVHAAFAAPDGLGFLAGEPDYAMLELLIALGADVEAADDRGRTPMALAMLRGDREAMRLLKTAGAKEAGVEQTEDVASAEDIAARVKALSSSVNKSDPMFSVADMRATVRWYESIGFEVIDRYEDAGELMFARLSFGKCEFCLSPGGTPGPRFVSLWLYTNHIEELYRLLKSRQLATSRARLAGSEDSIDVHFDEDLYEPFYGGRQFSLRDNNGLSVIFFQPNPVPSDATSTDGAEDSR